MLPNSTGTAVAVATGLCLATAAYAQSGGGFDLSWSSIDGGGGMFSTGGGFELGGSIGQPDAGPTPVMTGGAFELTGGFWGFVLTCGAKAPVDFDQDCDVDLSDLAIFESCASGPGVPGQGTPTCQAADRDSDNDVDQIDFAVFQRCFSGADAPADPNCAN
jgi:hypothetical protein